MANTTLGADSALTKRADETSQQHADRLLEAHRVAEATRSAWELATAALEAADEAVEVYSREVQDPAEQAYYAGKREYPKFEFMVDTGDAGVARMVVWNAATMKQFGTGTPGTDPLSIYAASQVLLIDAVDEHNRCLLTDLRCAEFQAEYDRLVDFACRRRDDVFALAAPDWFAVTYKLRLLGKHDHLASEADDDDPLPTIIADAERLAGTR